MTTIRTEGLATVDGDVRQYGMAKEGLIARQVMLGVVQTGDGLPIYHEVFAGNTAESPTLLPTMKTVLERFPSISRVVLVADRGLLSLDNLEALSRSDWKAASRWNSYWRFRDGVTANSPICCVTFRGSVRRPSRKSWTNCPGVDCV
ncbi:hypothetical protein MASR2M16_13570 [Thauera terpenica]